MAADPFSNTMSAGPVGTALEVMAAACADRAGILERQRERLLALFEAARRTRRYAAALQGRALRDIELASLPVLRKAGFMSHFADGLSDPGVTREALQRFCADPTQIGERFLGRYWVWQSSGSTGQPGIFVQDEAAMAVYDALEGLRRDSPRAWLRLLDPFYLSERYAFVGATEGHFASYVSFCRLVRMHPWVSTWQSFSILQPTDALVRQLDAFGPSLLATYPTAAVMLADQARAGRLKSRPQEIWTGGETLSPAMRRHVEQALGAPLRNSYGASEFLPIAWECSHGRLHVNADWVILEAVDRQGHAVPPGQVSHTTLLTNLANHLQPLIRIDIGDRIAWDERACPCGCALPVLQVQGRCDDALHLAGRRGRRITLLPLALSTVLEERCGVFDFQLCQTGPAALRLRLGQTARRDPSAGAHCREALRAFLAEHGVPRVDLRIEALPPAPRARSGKFQRVVAIA